MSTPRSPSSFSVRCPADADANPARWTRATAGADATSPTGRGHDWAVQLALAGVRSDQLVGGVPAGPGLRPAAVSVYAENETDWRAEAAPTRGGRVACPGRSCRARTSGPPGGTCSATGTGSANRWSRAAAPSRCPATAGRSKPASSCWATRARPVDPAHAGLRRPRPQRHLRRLPQVPLPRRSLQPVPARGRPHRGATGTPRGEARRPLAQRRATGAVAGMRGPGARRRPAPDQRLRLHRRPPRTAHAAGIPHPPDEPPGDQAGSPQRRQHRRIIRRSTSYGEPLPPTALTDDGKDRSLDYIALGAGAIDNVEFLQSELRQLRQLHGSGQGEGPAGGTAGQGAYFTVPGSPPRRVHGIHSFNTLRGGEYFFIPSLSAIRWLST